MASAWAAMLGPPASSARRWRTSRASAGGSAERSTPGEPARQARPDVAGAAGPRRPGAAPPSTTSSSTAASSRSTASVRQHVVLGGRVERQSVAGARRAPRSRSTRPPATQPVRLAVRRGLRARHAQQRPDDPARALGHPEQRPPAGRAQQPVEDGLGLVGGGVADGDQRVALRREPLRLRVAHRARPGLDVASGAPGAVHEQLDAERRAERAAVRLVGVGLRAAQAVVDVQRAHRRRARPRPVSAGRSSRGRR